MNLLTLASSMRAAIICVQQAALVTSADISIHPDDAFGAMRKSAIWGNVQRLMVTVICLVLHLRKGKRSNGLSLDVYDG